MENIKIKNRVGTWYIIDLANYKDRLYYLLESEQYGDEASALVVTSKFNEVGETLDGLKQFFQDTYS